MTGPADNCGECVTYERSVTAHPYFVRADGDDGVRASYQCANCGHRWYTSWGLSPEQMAEYGWAGAA